MFRPSLREKANPFAHKCKRPAWAICSRIRNSRFDVAVSYRDCTCLQSAHRTALLIMVAAYQSELRGVKKRGDAEMQAAFDAEIRRSV
jgi:hypothetical protein